MGVEDKVSLQRIAEKLLAALLKPQSTLRGMGADMGHSFPKLTAVIGVKAMAYFVGTDIIKYMRGCEYQAPVIT